MTALDRYVRLESDALWRATPDAQRRDVTLSFGDATLVISDGTGSPLAHWSLPALVRQNAGIMPAVYAPDDDGSELLEIADTTMVDAIEEVRKALSKSRPKPGKLRHLLTGGLVLLTVFLTIFWLPAALTRQTLAVVPQPTRYDIGAAMLAQMDPVIGPACQSPRANVAAARLVERVFGPDAPLRLIIVPRLDQGVVALPGGFIVLDDSLLRVSDDPAAVAGFMIASRAAVVHMDPLEALLSKAGLAVTFRLLTTGDMPPQILQNEAMALLTPPAQQADPAALRAMLADAQIPHGPYRAASDLLSGSTPDLGDDAMAGRAVPLILTDSDWVSLRNICAD